jgi:hypothetical protein
MEKQFKENVKQLLKDISVNHYKPFIVENIVNKFQDDNVKYLELS